MVSKDYEDLLRLFNKHKVRYCIVGAYAVAFYEVPRFTKDMDLFLEANSDNAKKVITALKEFGFSHPSLSEKDFSKVGKTIQIGYEPIRIDLLTSIDGCKFETVWKNRKMGVYGKEKTYFISRDDLVKNKKASNRKQDQVDIDLLKKKKRNH